MKRKGLLLLSILLAAPAALSSCSFIKYVEYNESASSEIEGLTEAKIEYQTEIRNLYDEGNYYLNEQRICMEYIKECRSKIEEASSLGEVTRIFDEYKIALLSVKTKQNFVDDFTNKLKSSFGENVLEINYSLNVAKDVLHLSTIIDTYAFYQISSTAFIENKFRVEPLFNYSSVKSLKDDLRANCSELARYSVDFDIKEAFEDCKYLDITLIPFDFSNRQSIPATRQTYNSLVTYNSNKDGFGPRSSDFDDFPLYKKNGKRIDGIWNTQQLWYALEKGYIPNCVKDSIAEKTFNEAKKILKSIIKEGMSDEEKIFNIYNYLAKTVAFATSNPSVIYEQANYAEGAIFNKIAVCRGIAKAYLIMLRLEGIESYLSFNDLIGKHEFVLIKLNNEFYISDSDYALAYNFLTYRSMLIEGSETTLNTYFNERYKDLKFASTLSEAYKNLFVYDKNLVHLTAPEINILLEKFDSTAQIGDSINFIYKSLDLNDLVISESLSLNKTSTFFGVKSDFIEISFVKES